MEMKFRESASGKAVMEGASSFRGAVVYDLLSHDDLALKPVEASG